MEECQERRHLCKRCGMGFSNGRILGGHMKGHMAKIAREKKVEARGGDAEEELGHVVRDIPKKSRKLVGSSVVSPTPDPRFDFECKICRKGFASIKGLFGHMRLHPRKEKKANKKAVSMESDHGEEQHRNSDVVNDLYHCPVRGKRSIRVHYDVVSDSETEEETVKEVAFCLVLLSRGVRNSEGYDSFEKMVENESTAVKKGMEVEEESFEIPDCDDEKNVESAESSSSSKNGVDRKQKRAKKNDQSCSGAASSSSSYKHKCPICSKEFMSARALGGHKRSHTMKKTTSILQEAAAAAKNVTVI